MTEEHGKALPADLERFILLAEVSGYCWKRGRDGAAETSQYYLQNITAIQSIMNVDVTCFLANLAIYGTHCTDYPDDSWVRKIPLNLSGYEMELIVPVNKIKDGVAELNIKNIPEENIEQLKSTVYCLADLLSFSTTAGMFSSFEEIKGRKFRRDWSERENPVSKLYVWGK